MPTGVRLTYAQSSSDRTSSSPAFVRPLRRRIERGNGHRGLIGEVDRAVTQALRDEVSKCADDQLSGVSCIADGPDSTFARAILDAGGQLVVIVPAVEYRDGLPATHHPTHDNLMGRAAEVVRLDAVESDATAHMNASLRVLDESDELIAVWDGGPARGYGGTADVVAAARHSGLPTTVIWPAGATR